MIEIKFPAERNDIALAIGNALVAIGGAVCHTDVTAPEVAAGYGGQTEEAHREAAPEKPELAETATAPATSTGSAPAATAPTGSPLVDEKGVAKDDAFCSTAADPFYATGSKRAGQWKKRKGVSDDAYDIWYEDQLEAVSGGLRNDDDANEQSAPEEQPNTAAAFAPAEQPAPQADPDVPTECGPFMAWVAQQQAAGHLTQEQVGAAYATAGVAVADLFSPPPEQIAINIAMLYGLLSAQVAA